MDEVIITAASGAALDWINETLCARVKKKSLSVFWIDDCPAFEESLMEAPPDVLVVSPKGAPEISREFGRMIVVASEDAGFREVVYRFRDQAAKKKISLPVIPYGGDRCAILCPAAIDKEILAMAGRLAAKLSAEQICYRICIGLFAKNYEDMILSAKMAETLLKKSVRGRNRILFLNETISVRASARSDTTAKACEYIAKNYWQPKLRVSDVAFEAHVSEKYLSTVFKRETGVSVLDYIEMTRLAEAKKLVMTTGLLMKEVALRCGFSTQSYFSQCFKNHFGYLPSKMRVQIQRSWKRDRKA